MKVMKLINITNAVIVIEKVQAVSLCSDGKSFNVVLDCGITQTFVYESDEMCKQNFMALVKILEQYLDGYCKL